MNNRKITALFFNLALALALAIAALPAQAAVPQTLNYQGQLASAAGIPVNSGPAGISMTFKLYDAATVGNLLWSETRNVVVSNGLYSVTLGGNPTALTPALFGVPLYLGISVAADAEMTPRIAMSSSATALRAAVADMASSVNCTGCLTTSNIAPDAVTAGNIAAGSISSSQLAAGAVTTSAISAWAITAEKLAPGAVTTSWTDGTGQVTTAVNVGVGTVAPVVNARLDVQGGAINIGGTGNADATLHIKSSFGGLDRLTQIHPTAASKPGLNLMASTNSAAAAQWWAWGPDTGNIWRIQPGTGFSGSTGLFIDNTGKVGIGTPTPSSQLEVRGASGTPYGGFFESTAIGGRGVFGAATGTGFTSGVYGSSESASGAGVLGNAIAGSGTTYGGYFLSASTSGVGVYGKATATSGVTNGVQGTSDSTWVNSSGVFGWATAGSGLTNGVLGASDSTSGAGVFGKATATSGATYGVYGTSASPNGIGVYGASPSIALYGKATDILGYGLYSDGNVYMAGAVSMIGTVSVTGSFSVAGLKSFKIDHPLDPANKYLVHASIESSDAMNLYNGNAVLDENGEAWVSLPEWFEALNRDFRYQLTCIGGFAPVYVAEKVRENRFRIAGGMAGMEVSWQVTGIRHDPYMNAHPMKVEEDKPQGDRGLYLNPEEYGQPREKGIGDAHRPPEPKP